MPSSYFFLLILFLGRIKYAVLDIVLRRDTATIWNEAMFLIMRNNAVFFFNGQWFLLPTTTWFLAKSSFLFFFRFIAYFPLFLLPNDEKRDEPSLSFTGFYRVFRGGGGMGELARSGRNSFVSRSTNERRAKEKPSNQRRESPSNSAYLTHLTHLTHPTQTRDGLMAALPVRRFTGFYWVYFRFRFK